MTRDVLIASMSKGQFPIAIVGIVIIIIVARMPQDEVGKLASNLLAKIESRYWAGFAFWLLTAIGWFYHARWQRKRIDREMKRISEERTQLQAKLINKKLESSES
jgi:hypothetical protein